MKKSAELMKERAALIEAQKRMHLLAEKETRDYTETETIEFRRLQGEIDALTAKIADAEAYEANLRMMAGNATPASTELGNSEQREHDALLAEFSLNKAIRSQLANGNLDGVELELHQETVTRAKKAGVSIGGLAVPMPGRRTEQRASGQTVTLDSGDYGGNLVATEQQPIIEFLRPRPLLATLGARMLTGLSGNLVFPINEGGIVAAWEGEIDSADPSKNKYGKKGMDPKRLSATVPISLQNLMQSSLDLEMFTAEEIRMAIDNALDLAVINGNGTGQPFGILNTTGVNVVAGGTNGLAPNWNNLVDMETPIFVENANGARMNYLFNSKTRGKLKKSYEVDGQTEKLLQKDGTVNGYPAVFSNHVPGNITKGTGTNLSAGIFGDFSQVIFGQWAFLDLSVDDKSQKKNGLIEITANTFVDILLRHPKAFSVIKDLIIT